MNLQTASAAAASGALARNWRVADGLRYGLLGLPLAFCALPLYVLMPNLYAKEWGVSLTALGAVLLGARLLDAVIDPLLGRWCDRLFARSLSAVLALGAASALVLGVGFSALFMPMLHDPVVLLWWAGFWLVITYAAYSAVSVAHQSWGAMLGGDALYRSRIVAWREGLGLVGVLLAAVTPALLGVPVMLALLWVGLLVGWLAWRQAPRPCFPAALEVASGHVSRSLGGKALCFVSPARCAGSSFTYAKRSAAQTPGPSALWHPWRNTHFRRLLVVYLLNGIASAIPATLVLFFVQDRLQASEAMQSGALGMYFACGALSMPLWLRAVARWGLVRSWRLGMLLSIAVFAGASQLGAGDALWFLLVCALSGAALGSDLAIPGALLAGVIQQGGDRGRAEGAYFGWWNFATKLNLALAAGLALPLLGWLGYEPGTRDAAALGVLTAAYCLLPCVLKAMAAIALHIFIIQPTAQPQSL
ncbi:MAG: MFS transporter [Burkholderiales bacterium]|nr:MFS transporter [Burkholderiales bacterium]